MAQRHPRVIVWKEDTGTAPDGTRYEIASESARGEGKFSWAMVQAKSGFLVDVPHEFAKLGPETRDRAKQQAEAHYRAKTEKEGA